MSTPWVSVLLPVYQGAATLAESLDSVLRQEGIDFELIVVLDGSTDGSAAIVAARADRRLQVVERRDNRGLFPTLQEAAERARGHWLRLWSQDDRMLPGCLAREKLWQERYPDAGMGYCAVAYIDGSGREFSRPPLDDTPEYITPELAREIMANWGSIAANIAAASVRADCLRQIGGFDTTLKVSGDLDLYARIAERWPLVCIKEHLVQVRSHAGQLSKRRDSFLAFMREDRIVAERLLATLPAELHRPLRQRWLYTRERAAFHHLVRALLGGDLALARAVANELSARGVLAAAAWTWLRTLNGRIGLPAPVYSSARGSS